jgi:hypothetical protein
MWMRVRRSSGERFEWYWLDHESFLRFWHDLCTSHATCCVIVLYPGVCTSRSFKTELMMGFMILGCGFTLRYRGIAFQTGCLRLDIPLCFMNSMLEWK